MQWTDWSKPSLWISLMSITFNPLAWNIVARNEYRNKTLTRMFGGNARMACYFLAFMIFSFGILRDTLYHHALQEQPTIQIVSAQLRTVLATALFIIGQTFVITSTYALGITGTFLGDYFGILMDKRVEGFPFNIVENPMYTGSTLCFIATALWYDKPAGLLVTLYVHLCYCIALHYEGPFTTMIYSQKSKTDSKRSQSYKRSN